MFGKWRKVARAARHHALLEFGRHGGNNSQVSNVGTRWRWVLSFTLWPPFYVGNKSQAPSGSQALSEPSHPACSQPFDWAIQTHSKYQIAFKYVKWCRKPQASLLRISLWFLNDNNNKRHVVTSQYIPLCSPYPNICPCVSVVRTGRQPSARTSTQIGHLATLPLLRT
jgi:hypothetical protein